jgi:hypothetical protein
MLSTGLDIINRPVFYLKHNVSDTEDPETETDRPRDRLPLSTGPN